MIFRNFFILIILLLGSRTVYCQVNFMVLDSVYTAHVMLYESSLEDNGKYCQQRIGKDIVKHLPSKVSQYGYEDGRIFDSKAILINNRGKQAFLMRLVEGEIILYYLKDENGRHFFMDKEGQLIYLNKKDTKTNTYYKSIILDLTKNKDGFDFPVDDLRYTQKSLSEFFHAFNSN